MTDSVIQFKYSDDVHMTAIYIKSDTHQQIFIPLLLDIIKECEYTNRNRVLTPGRMRATEDSA